MFGALAELERSLIRERIQAGLGAARRAGRTGGRAAKLTDDDLDVATTLLANPDITVAKVAERVGVSPATALSLYARRADGEYGSRLRRSAMGRADSLTPDFWTAQNSAPLEIVRGSKSLSRIGSAGY